MKIMLAKDPVSFGFVVVSGRADEHEARAMLREFFAANREFSGGKMKYFHAVLMNHEVDTALRIRTCVECGKKYFVFSAETFHGRYPFDDICYDCAREKGATKDTPVCAVCDRAVFEDAVNITDSMIVHAHCATSLAQCESCGGYTTNPTTVYVGPAAMNWCENCVERTFMCDRCGRIVDDVIPVDNGDRYFCRECTEDYTETCEMCGEHFTSLINGLCRVCHENANKPSDLEIIVEQNIPAPRHGVEIEASKWNVDTKPDFYHRGKMAKKPFPTNTRFEDDQSIEGSWPGEAIMAEPSNNLAWTIAWLNEIYGLIGYTNITCGMHVHISVNNDEDYIGKFYTLEDFAFALNGKHAKMRMNSTYSIPTKFDPSHGKYSALRAVERNHLEVRAFYTPHTIYGAIVNLAFVIGLNAADGIEKMKDVPFSEVVEAIVDRLGWSSSGSWLGWPDVSEVRYKIGEVEKSVKIPSVEERIEIVADLIREAFGSKFANKYLDLAKGGENA